MVKDIEQLLKELSGTEDLSKKLLDFNPYLKTWLVTALENWEYLSEEDQKKSMDNFLELLESTLKEYKKNPDQEIL